MSNQEINDYLRECGVCTICQLRFLKARGDDYVDPKATFESLHVKFHDPVENDEQAAKKARLSSTCPTCLGLFTEEFQSQLIESILAANIDRFECDSIVIALTMPIILQIRQLSMWYALQRKFGSRKIQNDRSPDVPIKEAIKLILNPIICDKLQKKNDVNGIMINIMLKHSSEEEELAKFRNLHESRMNYTKNSKRQEISRTLLEKQYTPALVKAEIFEEYFSIPPPLVDEPLSLETTELTGPMVYVAGRYRKISRELSHTPWVLHGERIMDDSIEEIIIRHVAPYFCEDTSKVVFMSSGREDVDVRCLGKGRPFLLEIPNALKSSLTSSKAYEMEQAIDKSCKVSVHNLQVVAREEQVHIKTGEEMKRKFYRALCTLNEPVTLEDLQKLNKPEEFVVYQKTPIRVLHRRPLHTRPRTIYSIKAYVDPKNLNVLVLDIVTQAGTYIKELVHGEFGRTSPSLSSIIGKPMDILALDVVAIDLDWPKEVDNSQHSQSTSEDAA